MKFISYTKTAEVLQPGKKSFYLPASAVAPQYPPILSLAPISSVGGNHFYPPILFQLAVELVRYRKPYRRSNAQAIRW